LHDSGCAVVTGVLDPAFLEETRAALYRARQGVLEEVGAARLAAAGEAGVVRLPLKFDPHFFRLLELPALLAVVDATLGETAILHLQNGFILPSFAPGAVPALFQTSFHRDFPRHLGTRVSVNALFAIDAFSAENGATLVVPGSHLKEAAPTIEFMRRSALPVECPAGSMVVFDSTLWHAAGPNTSGRERLAVNHQFTVSYLKQQIDYVRALGDAAVLAQRPRTQQLLGWYTRVVTSLDEYYRPEAERLYRRGQG
jgi:ectoine hydroxylase-related dioxygenase (phytanoyl-CoA dioxygenase family)